MSEIPAFRQRVDDFALLFRMKLASLGPMSKKQYSLAMLIDENDLASHSFSDLTLVNETAFRPMRAKSSDRSPHGNIGITGQRSFLQQIPFRDLVVRVTPYSSQEMAIANVLHADGSIVHDPTRRVEMPTAEHTEQLEIEGLDNVFAHQESLVTGDLKFKVLFIFSHVGQVLFSVQVSSRSDAWTWGEAATITGIQADKIRQTSAVLSKIFNQL